jgi:hypothetical protein
MRLKEYILFGLSSILSYEVEPALLLILSSHTSIFAHSNFLFFLHNSKMMMGGPGRIFGEGCSNEAGEGNTGKKGRPKI